MVVILGALASLMFTFNFLSIVHWISFLVLVGTLALTCYIYLEQPHRKEFKSLQKTYAYFLDKKDKKIDELENKSQILFNTSMKRSEADVELKELKKRLEKKN